jgi:hypothetical protein
LGTRVIRSNNATSNNTIGLYFSSGGAGQDSLLIRNGANEGSGQISVSNSGLELLMVASGTGNETKLTINDTIIQALTDTNNSDFQISELFKGLSLGSNGDANWGTLTPTTLTADRTYTLQNASGTIAFLSDIPATPTLSTVLVFGNTTGGNDIVLTSNDSITSSTTTNAIYLDNGSGEIAISTDGLSYLESNLRISSSQILLTGSTTAELKFLTTANTFTDNNTTKKGLQYAADYSADYTTRSLVDKAYVDSVAGGGVSPVAETYTLANVTPDRTFDPTSTDPNEMAQVLGTLITDLKTSGIIL